MPDAGFFHGKTGARLVVVGPINLPVGRLFVEEVITECRKRGATRVDVLAFEFEMGLFPAVLDEAKQKGHRPRAEDIPPEVFDKRAVERGQVRFHDVATSKSRRASTRGPLDLAVELTDFSVYLLTGAGRRDRRRTEGRQERGCVRGRAADQDQQGQAGRRHARGADEALDRLGGLLGGGFQLREPQGDHQGSEGRRHRRRAGTPARPGARAARAGTCRAEFEERWTGAYIFENEWQSFRTRQNRELELTTRRHTYAAPGRYTIAVKVIDIFGNDTMTLVPVTVG